MCAKLVNGTYGFSTAATAHTTGGSGGAGEEYPRRGLLLFVCAYRCKVPVDRKCVNGEKSRRNDSTKKKKHAHAAARICCKRNAKGVIDNIIIFVNPFI